MAATIFLKRKRILLVASVVAYGMSTCCFVQGFVSLAVVSRSVSISSLHSSKQNNYQVHTHSSHSNNDNKNYYNNKYQTKRLSHEEQQQLLTKAVEMRRITKIKSDIALQAGKVPVFKVNLSRAAGYGDEIDLLDEAIRDGEIAREALLTSNMGLVHFCVNDILRIRRNYRSQLSNLSKEDLVQEGAIGLARAVDRWNPEVGGRFSTYAVYWIRAAVLRCIAERDEFVRIPEHVAATIRKVSRAAKTLGLNIDESDFMSPQWKEARAAKALAIEAGLSEKQLIDAMKVRERRRNGIMSFESWMQSRKQSAITSFIVDNTEFETNSLRADTENIKAELGKFLRPKEIEALSWRYGLNSDQINTSTDVSTIDGPRNYLREVEMELFPDSSAPATSVSTNIKKIPPVRGKWGEAMSFTEVGNKMHVSAEYGRKLCHAALTKLQRAAADGSLELGLLF